MLYDPVITAIHEVEETTIQCSIVQPANTEKLKKQSKT